MFSLDVGMMYQSHSFLAGDSGVVFSISLSMSTRNFGTPLHKGGRDTALEAGAQLYSNNIS